MHLTDYIIHIDPPHEGCGIFVGNYFITAGHVVDNQANIAIYYKRKKLLLNKDNCIFLSSLNEKTWNTLGNDIAIYKFDSVTSPIEFYQDKVNINDVFNSVSYKVSVKKTDGEINIFSSDNRECIDLIKCEGRVVDLKDNFIVCKMSYPLRSGSSGSPLLLNNKLVGILSGGVESTDICVFQNIESIIKLIENKVD